MPWRRRCPSCPNNITAVRIDNPQLALGNVVGANMVNMFTMAMVALLFGGRRFLQQVAPEQGYLIVLAAILTGLAVIFAGVQMGINVWQIGLSSMILLVVYVIGMRIVYQRRPAESAEEGQNDPGISLSRAWLMFGLVSLGVIIAGVFLAQSVDRVADLTGISSGVLGILAVSIVTTMPEASATVAAARMGAADLGVAGLYGSWRFQRHYPVLRRPLLPQGYSAQLPGAGAFRGRHLRGGVDIVGRRAAMGTQPVAPIGNRSGIGDNGRRLPGGGRCGWRCWALRRVKLPPAQWSGSPTRYWGRSEHAPEVRRWRRRIERSPRIRRWRHPR